MKNKRCFSPSFVWGGTVVQHHSPQDGNLLASFHAIIYVADYSNGMEE